MPNQSTTHTLSRHAKPNQAGDKVLIFLQEAAELGLSYYPERLGQLFLVNVAPANVHHLRLVACALGLRAAVGSGRLRILPGDLPKWAPELGKVRKGRGRGEQVYLSSFFCLVNCLLAQGLSVSARPSTAVGF